MNSIRALIDDLPTESLDLFVLHYESERGVGGYYGSGLPWDALDESPKEDDPPCPRCALGFSYYERGKGVATALEDEGVPMLYEDHPAHRVEVMADRGQLDLSELYTACVLSLMERDGVTVEVVARAEEVPA